MTQKSRSDYPGLPATFLRRPGSNLGRQPHLFVANVLQRLVHLEQHDHQLTPVRARIAPKTMIFSPEKNALNEKP